MQCFSCQELKKDELAELRKQLDKDHDKKFNLEEFKALAAALSAKLGAPKPSDDVVNQIFKESDKNKSGSLNDAEFDAALAKLQKKLQAGLASA